MNLTKLTKNTPTKMRLDNIGLFCLIVSNKFEQSVEIKLIV